MTDSRTIYLLLPEIILISAATIIYVVAAFRHLRSAATWLAIAGLGLSALFLCGQSSEVFSTNTATISGPLAVDQFEYLIRWAVLAVGLVLLLLTSGAQSSDHRAEESASILLMLAGLMIIAAANELILLFVGLELVSIPTYVVLYIGRSNALGQEAASKYFFLSILSSAVLLYGFSFLYGVGGSTRLDQIAAVLSPSQPAANFEFNPVLVPMGLLLTFAGLAFRLTAVPFHFYAPDVYQGTSNANAALLSTLPKIAGLAVLARILLTALPGWESLGWKVVLVVCIPTMTLGNVLALWQNNIRRLLAYSSIAHAGYLLIGVAAVLAAKSAAAGPAIENASGAIKESAGLNGLGSAMFYLAVYMFATLGTFAALVYLSRSDRSVDTLADIAGLNRAHPLVALMIAVFMFSLAGIPPLAGFWGKFSLLYSALTVPKFSPIDGAQLRPWFIGLAIVTVLNAAIGAAYYLRVIGTMYFRSPGSSIPRAGRGFGPALAIVACAAIVIGVGLMPGKFLDAAVDAGASLRTQHAQQTAAAPSADRAPLSIAAGH